MSPTTIEQAEQVVLDFAGQTPPPWEQTEEQRTFALARKLKRFGGNYEDYQDVIRLYCEKTGADFTDVFTEFVSVWPTIKFADDGIDGFDWAVEMARDEPIPLAIPPPLPVYQYISSIAWHLGVKNEPEPFLLPIPRLEKALKCNRPAISRILKWLIKTNVIVCVDENYKRPEGGKKGKAKLYRLYPCT